MIPARKRALLQRAQQLTSQAGSAARKAATPLVRKYGFPYVAPPLPKGVEIPRQPNTLGADYDTEWAREPWAQSVRDAIVRGPMRVAVDLITRPKIEGRDRLTDLMGLDPVPPVIFTPNHHSHLDTGLMIRAIPAAWRHNLVVAAAADYFFDQRWKAAISALALNAIPIDREVTSRKSSDLLRDLIADGHSLLIYPEGGRSPDGWGQEFKGGAAYLAGRTGAPVVPVYIDGTGAILGKGNSTIRPGRTKVVFGRPLVIGPDENTRRFNARIQAAVTQLGDEARTDYWDAARRAARAENPALTGPAYSGWRRDWELTEHRNTGMAGQRRRKKRRWPNLDR